MLSDGRSGPLVDVPKRLVHGFLLHTPLNIHIPLSLFTVMSTLSQKPTPRYAPIYYSQERENAYAEFDEEQSFLVREDRR